MRFVTQASIALVLAAVSTAALASASVSTSALVSGQDSQASCLTAGRQVTEALNANQQNDAARQERKMGLEFCNAGYYHQGMTHYARAMELLGVRS